MSALNNRWKACSVEFPPAQAVAEDAVEKSVYTLQDFWMASLDAERVGDITHALELLERILDEVGRSYAAYLRAGWLHYQAGGYTKALEFYEKASRCSPGADTPLFGAMGCYVAMGDTYNATRVIKVIIDLDQLGESVSTELAALQDSGDFHVLPPFPLRAFTQHEPLECAAACGAA